MTRSRILAAAFLGPLLVDPACAQSQAPAGTAASLKPNILLIVSDDQGKNGLGCYGASAVKTPNIDRLAAQGMRFDAHTVMPVCMPTRAALHTGRWGFRTGLSDNMSVGWRFSIDGPVSGGRVLASSEATVPKLLRKAGYATALVGKYHLGCAGPDSPNVSAGWDHYYGDPGGGLTSYENPVILRDGNNLGHVPGNATDLYTEEALRWIEGHRDGPFCLWLAHNTPHGPLWAPEKYLEPYRDIAGPMRHYCAMIAHLDESVGRVLAKLDEWKLADKTLVVFMSDNGATPTQGGEKGKVTELGTCVPLIARWPGRVKPGSATASLTNVVDLLPTFAEVAGVPLPADRTIDGVSLVPLFADPAREVREINLVYWQRRFAIRKGSLKLVTSATADDGKDKLYDLAKDPAEKTNEIGEAAYAEPLGALRAVAARYREEVKREAGGTATNEGPVRKVGKAKREKGP